MYALLRKVRTSLYALLRTFVKLPVHMALAGCCGGWLRGHTCHRGLEPAVVVTEKQSVDISYIEQNLEYVMNQDFHHNNHKELSSH